MESPTEKDHQPGEKSPILPKYYKAEMADGSGKLSSRPRVSFSGSRNSRCRILVILAILVFLIIVIGLAIGLGTYYGTKSSSSSKPLTNSISRDDLRELLVNLEATAINNSRSVLTGYNQSAKYVFDTLEEYGYEPWMQNFAIPVPEENEGTFKVKFNSDQEIDYPQYSQFQIMIYSAGCSEENGDTCTWGLASLIDDEESDFGCDIPDEDKVNDKAVLIRYIPYNRDGTANCTVYEKAMNAKEAGAAAVIFVSDDPANTAIPRTRVFERNDDGTVSYVDIPSVGINNATGNQLITLSSSNDDLTVTLELSAKVTIANTFNVFAETKEGRGDRTIMFGSHLDSVPAGPGINDDGSGSMLNLLVAKKMSELNLKPKNKVRFAWWGAEELGLLGSRYYVYTKTPQERQNISLYLNFDMVGSPNYIRGVYSAESAMNDELLGPLTTIQDLFIEYFNNTKKAYILNEFTSGSDYRPFLDVGIPAGGLFTGAGSIKTEEEWLLFGGLRNVAHDPCYHQFCDTVNNVDFEAYEEMSKSATYTLESLMEQEDLEGYLKGEKST